MQLQHRPQWYMHRIESLIHLTFDVNAKHSFVEPIFPIEQQHTTWQAIDEFVFSAERISGHGRNTTGMTWCLSLHTV